VRAFDSACARPAELKGHLVTSIDEAVREADAAVFLVDHAEFKLLAQVDSHHAGTGVIDTRNCLDARTWHDAGFDIARVGSPLLLHGV